MSFLTVAKLKKMLAEYPDDMIIVTDGYQYGFDNFKLLVVDAILNQNRNCADGQHDDLLDKITEDDFDDMNDYWREKAVKCLCISRKNHYEDEDEDDDSGEAN